MLDIRLIRENPDFVKERLRLRDEALTPIVDEILSLDTERRAAETQLQQHQAERNRLSKEIGGYRKRGEDSSALEAQVKEHSTQMAELSVKSEEYSARQREILLGVPNLPAEAVPVGKSAEDNPVIRTWGEKPVVPNAKDHLTLAQAHKMLDFERATKLAGAGFTCYLGAGARLERALISFLLDLHTSQHGYLEVCPPFLIKPQALVGTSQLPKFEEQLYRVDRDDLYLAPTAEVPVTNLHAEEIVAVKDLPIKYAAYTPCFRREAGSAGLGTRGLIRMHQFDKVELVKICTPETADAELAALTADAEKVLQLLGLHYRVVDLCTGDIGFGSARTFDIEVWAPGQNDYLEVSSCSHFGDFQARRMNLRYKGADGKNQFCHTLNGSGTALARLFVALLENGQREDGSIALPEPLHAYFGAKEIR